METQATPPLESEFAFLQTNEWKVLVTVFEYYTREANKTNIRKAAPFWTEQRKLEYADTHYAWEEIIAKLDGIRNAMWEIQGYIAKPTRHSPSLMRTNCDAISETIVTIVHSFAFLHADFTRYLHDNKYDTVKMKYFKQGSNGLWGGVHVKCGKLFGGVQDLPLLRFLHRIYEVFLLPKDPDPEGYFNRWPRRLCTWPEIATIPHYFRYKEPAPIQENVTYREEPRPMPIVNPDGTHVWAKPVPRDGPLEEHGMRSDSSGDERDERDDSAGVVRDVRDSVRTWNFGHDSDDELDPVVEDAHRVIRLNRPIPRPEPDSDDDGVVAGSHRAVHTTPGSDDDDVAYPDLNAGFWDDEHSVRSNAHLTTMLHDLNQLSLS